MNELNLYIQIPGLLHVGRNECIQARRCFPIGGKARFTTQFIHYTMGMILSPSPKDRSNYLKTYGGYSLEPNQRGIGVNQL